MLRCKAIVSGVRQPKTDEGKVIEGRIVLTGTFCSVIVEPSLQWCKWTPMAPFELVMANPPDLAGLEIGAEFIVDFIPAAARVVGPVVIKKVSSQGRE